MLHQLLLHGNVAGNFSCQYIIGKLVADDGQNLQETATDGRELGAQAEE